MDSLNLYPDLAGPGSSTYVRTEDHEAERNRLLDEIEQLKQETFALEYSLSNEAGEYPDRKAWDKEHDQEVDCSECGHPYYRHFDSYENNRPVGCKYCECRIFQEPIPLPEKHEEKGRMALRDGVE
jgi:DNA-directed RNA polymerase subunit RPC12/RpoP